MDNKKVWYVTGASKGLGLALVKKLLAEGHRVAATSRSSESLIKAVGPSSAVFLPLQVDLLDETSVQQSIERTVVHFDTIDVVVNNAGYGQLGALEELSDDESRKNFDVNVFGVLNVVRKVLPYLRTQGSGHILNIGSIAGYNAAFAGWGIYCATKFAVTGLTEALAAELKPLGIYATVVYPGYFRTNFLAQDSLTVPAAPIAAYEAARASQILHQTAINGHQAGDPEKAAAVLIRIAEAGEPPVHLFLGKDAYAMVDVKDAAVKKDMEDWRAATTATDIEE
jgi:NAD(P)-dependent dehydrogenase (short-subunit alcohol dehydrogenase family)